MCVRAKVYAGQNGGGQVLPGAHQQSAELPAHSALAARRSRFATARCVESPIARTATFWAWRLAWRGAEGRGENFGVSELSMHECMRNGQMASREKMTARRASRLHAQGRAGGRGWLACAPAPHEVCEGVARVDGHDRRVPRGRCRNSVIRIVWRFWRDGETHHCALSPHERAAEVCRRARSA